MFCEGKKRWGHIPGYCIIHSTKEQHIEGHEKCPPLLGIKCSALKKLIFGLCIEGDRWQNICAARVPISVCLVLPLPDEHLSIFPPLFIFNIHGIGCCCCQLCQTPPSAGGFPFPWSLWCCVRRDAGFYLAITDTKGVLCKAWHNLGAHKIWTQSHLSAAGEVDQRSRLQALLQYWCKILLCYSITLLKRNNS